jgi:hypothetical protein
MGEEGLRMTLSDRFRAIGYVLILVGVGCFPMAMGASAKRDLSTFNHLADLGLFWKVGAAMVGLGIACLLASSLIPRR